MDEIIEIIEIIVLILTILIISIILLELINISRLKADKFELVSMKIKKIIGVFLAVIGAVPLIAYPFVMLANVMSAAVFFEPWSLNILFDKLFMMGLIIVTTSYPLIYIVSNILFFYKSKSKNLLYTIAPIVTLVIVIVTVSFNINYNNIYDNDGNMKLANVKIFKETSAWEVAKAVRGEKINKIESLIEANSSLINTKEGKYGATLLLWAIETKKYKSVKVLLELGADPNIPASGELGTPLMILVDRYWRNKDPDDFNMMELLLEHKANPSVVVIRDRFGSVEYATPLTEAIVHNDFQTVKLLVDNGANINYKDEFGITPSVIAIKWAVNAYYDLDSDILDYLVFDNGADLSGVHSYTSQDREDGIFMENVELLRAWIFDIDSPEYHKKQEYIERFEEFGQEYQKTEIKPYLLRDIKKKYPDDWEEYIKIY